MKVFKFKATDRTNKHFDDSIVDDGRTHAALNGERTLCGIQMDGDDGYTPGEFVNEELTCALCLRVVDAVIGLLEN
jgi:hypothetical protein